MSIANLFEANPYDLFCDSLTAGTIVIDGPGETINAANIDTPNFGEPMTIAPVKASSLTLGHFPITTTIQGAEVVVPGELKSNIIRSNGASVITIGTGATGLNLIPTVGDVVIDNAGPSTNFVDIGNFGCQGVIIGKFGGTTQFLSPVTFQSGGGSIVMYAEMPVLFGTGTGCIINTPFFIEFRAQRINAIVYLSWRFTGPVVAATIASTLNIIETLDMDFRPATPVSFSTLASGTTTIPLPVVANNLLPAIITINGAGAIFFSFAPATHNGDANWVIGETVRVIEGNVSYTIA